MNKLELRILSERLYEAVKGHSPTISHEDETTLKNIEAVLEEEFPDDV